MFGIKLITKRELALINATMTDQRAEIARLREQVNHERLRAEGAINALLIKQERIAITPNDGPSFQQEEEIKAKEMDIFADGKMFTEEELLKELQK